MQFLRSVLAQDETVTPATVVTYDLPVNPLSHLILTLKFLAVENLTTNAEILAAIESIRILHRGSSVISVSQADMWALSAILLGKGGIRGNHITDDNSPQFITMIIPCGRVLFNPDECFPATRSGELQLQITYAPSFTGFDNVQIQAETVELLGANPKQYLKCTSLSLTPVPGDNDLDLPIGNDLIGIMLYSTTVPADISETTSANQVKLLVDNVEKYYSQANWESLRADIQWRCGRQLGYNPAIHRLIEGTPNVIGGIQQVIDELENYAFLDFDPLLDSSFLLKTAGLSSVKLRINAEDTNVIRAVPCELVRI